MNIIAVDDESLALEGVLNGLKKAVPGAAVRGFRDPSEALEDTENEPADVAFLDIEMREISGIELAGRLKEQNPRINIIFTTGYKEYMEDAFDIHASGYIMKPVTPDKLKKELEQLRFPVESAKDHIIVKTFGEFGLFIEGQAVTFLYQKSKELLAVLIDACGNVMTNARLIEMLWQDDEGSGSHASYLRNLISDLTSTLKKYGADDIIVRRRGVIGIDKTGLSCDYYDYLDGKISGAENADEYLSQYAWAEPTREALRSKQ